TGARQERRDEPLIGAEQSESGPRRDGHARGPGIAVSASWSSPANAVNGRRSAAGRPGITGAARVRPAAPVARGASRDAAGARVLTANGEGSGSFVARQSTIMDGRSIRLPRWKSA